jgi:site-specific recombinase XerD
MDFMLTYLTEKEERKLFNTIKSRAGKIAARDFWMLKLMRATGIRVATLTGLTIDDVISLRPGGYLKLRPEICKNKHSYEIFITEEVFGILQKLIKNAKKFSETEFLVANGHNRRTSDRAVQHRCKYWDETSGLNIGFTPHWFRHTKAMRIMHNSSAKDPRMIVKRVLGHKSMVSTEIYTKPTREDFEKSAGA